MRAASLAAQFSSGTTHFTIEVEKALGLSGKQAIEAHKEERAAFKAKVEDFAKGAAIIGGAIAVGRSGLKAYREETRLMAGAAGVDIDRLSDSWDGLKTRMDLLTLAQAGHRGAWKLTTGQLEQVSEAVA